MIKGLNKGKPVLNIECKLCGTEYESRYNRGQLIKYLEEFGEYQNLQTEPCPNCGSIEIINLNLPLHELEQEFMDEYDMPQEERTQRAVIKDFMLNEVSFEEKQ